MGKPVEVRRCRATVAAGAREPAAGARIPASAAPYATFAQGVAHAGLSARVALPLEMRGELADASSTTSRARDRADRHAQPAARRPRAGGRDRAGAVAA